MKVSSYEELHAKQKIDAQSQDTQEKQENGQQPEDAFVTHVELDLQLLIQGNLILPLQLQWNVLETSLVEPNI